MSEDIKHPETDPGKEPGRTNVLRAVAVSGAAFAFILMAIGVFSARAEVAELAARQAAEALEAAERVAPAPTKRTAAPTNEQPGPRGTESEGADLDNAPATPNGEVWSPFADLDRLQDRMNRLFGQMMGSFRDHAMFDDLTTPRRYYPSVDLRARPERYVLHVDVPGATMANVHVKLDGRRLTVFGERSTQVRETDDKDRLVHEERRTGSFERTVTLPGPVKSDGMTTKLEDGVLEIVVPRLRSSSES